MTLTLTPMFLQGNGIDSPNGIQWPGTGFCVLRLSACSPSVSMLIEIMSAPYSLQNTGKNGWLTYRPIVVDVTVHFAYIPTN